MIKRKYLRFEQLEVFRPMPVPTAGCWLRSLWCPRPRRRGRYDGVGGTINTFSTPNSTGITLSYTTKLPDNRRLHWRGLQGHAAFHHADPPGCGRVEILIKVVEDYLRTSNKG